jgi:hypothetical protein
MTIFEPLFLLLALATIAALATAGVRAASGNLPGAARMLRRLALGMAAYFTVVIAVSALSPRRFYRVGDTQCFDDWCIAVVEVQQLETPPAAIQQVSLKLSNRARGTPMGEKGTVVFLTDAQGRRYDPLPDAGVPLDVRLLPGESIVATRRFAIAADARDLGLVYTHEGGFPIGWLIIGEGGWFSKPPLVRLN